MHHSNKDFITTKHTKVTKDSDVFIVNFVLFVPFVVRFVFSCLVAALPRWGELFTVNPEQLYF